MCLIKNSQLSCFLDWIEGSLLILEQFWFHVQELVFLKAFYCTFTVWVLTFWLKFKKICEIFALHFRISFLMKISMAIPKGVYLDIWFPISGFVSFPLLTRFYFFIQFPPATKGSSAVAFKESETLTQNSSLVYFVFM